MSKNKHYTTIERKIFLDILKDFKHVIEVKKSDSSTLHDKEIAWTEICNRYNDSTMIMQDRTIQQLKKLWANLKQTQRELLTKEKQSHLAIGGGPPLPETNIDPDVATIAPHLMQTAPVLFTSNMTESEIKEKGEYILNIVPDGNVATILYENNDDEIMDEEFRDKELRDEELRDEELRDEKLRKIQEDGVTMKTIEKENKNINISNKALSMKSKKNIDASFMQTMQTIKVKKSIENIASDEDAIKIDRIKGIMEQEKEIADIRKAHEKKLAVMKEELCAQEIRAAVAKADLAELQLQKEKEKHTSLRI